MLILQEILADHAIAFEAINAAQAVAFAHVLPLSQADTDSLVFINHPDDATLHALSRARFAAALVPVAWAAVYAEALAALHKPLVLVDNPRLAIAYVLQAIAPNDAQAGVIHPTAVIDPKAQLHPSVSVGPFSVVEACRIGKNSRIGSHCHIGARAEIGENVVIHDFCKVGGPGFGFVRDETGAPVYLPHVGQAVLENGVELFSYSNVDYGTLTETRVCQNAKIDHYGHIGHNCVVGEASFIAGGTILCGGAKVGAFCFVGAGSRIKETVVVGDNVMIGLGSVVLADVADGATVAGVPARRLG